MTESKLINAIIMNSQHKDIAECAHEWELLYYVRITGYTADNYPIYRSYINQYITLTTEKAEEIKKIVFDKHLKCPDICACGKMKLKHISIIYNTHTNKSLVIGSSCIKKYFKYSKLNDILKILTKDDVRFEKKQKEEEERKKRQQEQKRKQEEYKKYKEEQKKQTEEDYKNFVDTFKKGNICKLRINKNYKEINKKFRYKIYLNSRKFEYLQKRFKKYKTCLSSWKKEGDVPQYFLWSFNKLNIVDGFADVKFYPSKCKKYVNVKQI